MSVSGPSPLGTLMVQRVEAALGSTLAQQANIATGARPDAVTQPGQPDKADPTKNPPPKEQDGARRAGDQGGRQSALNALARKDPEIAKLLAARNAPMTGYTASAPTTLGNAAKAILALLQQFPESRPAVSGRAPLLTQSPGQPGAQAGAGGSPGMPTSGAPAAGVGGNLDPRAIQALMQQAGDGAQGADGRAATQANAGAAARGPAGQSASAGTPAAMGQAAGSGATAGAAGSLPASAGMVGQLAVALSHALQGSGLFYEAHLREFAFGQRTLAQLRGEPQAQAGQDTARAGAQDTGGARAGGGTAPGLATASANQQAPSGQASQTAQAAHTAQSAGTAAQSSAQLAGALLGMDPSTHALVRQQLETLATQSFAWQGEAWPGSDLEWEVQRRGPDQGDDNQTDSWATRLKLTLPGLGDVHARLSLAGTQLVLHLAAPDGAELMTDHTESLRTRLLGQGLHLNQLTISREPGIDPKAVP